MDKNQEHTINNADICELAHNFTVDYCNERGVVVDKEIKDEETSYTEEAQEVFDKYHDLITEGLGIEY